MINTCVNSIAKTVGMRQSQGPGVLAVLFMAAEPWATVRSSILWSDVAGHDEIFWMTRRATSTAGELCARAELDGHVRSRNSPRNLFRGLVLSYLCSTCCQRTGDCFPVLSAS